MGGIRDRDHQCIWHPFTQMQLEPYALPVRSAHGATLVLEDGSTLIDGISSWWVNIHGHAHPHIAKAIAQQATQLEQVIFAGFTHEPAVRLAEKLIEILPGEMGKIFFSDDGSTSVEVALKMALQYFYNNGEERKAILAFEDAYHGDTFGAMSAGGRSAFSAPFDAHLFDVDHLPLPLKGNEQACLERLKTLLSQKKYAAFIFEPLVQGSAGMRMYGAGVLEEIMDLCKEHGVLLIADEVFTGWGRTGTMFACHQLDIQPDLVCVSKGLTGGFLPMGITACKQFIYDAFLSGEKTKALFHGHSYTANPIACAAALASLELFDENTWKSIEGIHRAHIAFAHELENHPRLLEARVCGTILALEFKTDQHSGYFNSLRDEMYAYFIKKGLLLRPLGNVLYVLPPYCIRDEELQKIYSAIREFLN